MLLFATALASLFASVVVGYSVNPTQGPGYNSNCFTCPQISSFRHGLFSETPGFVKLIPTGNEFICSYWASSYIFDNKLQPERYLASCYYDSQGHLQSGASECYNTAATNADCVAVKQHNEDKGTYLKKCDQPGCAYETAACYTCPKLKTDYVDIDTRSSNLECRYYTSDSLDDTCRYNSSTGALTGSMSGICSKTASQDSPCLEQLKKDKEAKDKAARRKQAIEDRKKRIAKIEADKKEYLNEHGLFGVGCVAVMKDLLPPFVAVALFKGPLAPFVSKGEETYIDICKMTPEAVLSKLKSSAFAGAPKIKQYIKGLEFAISKTRKP